MSFGGAGPGGREGAILAARWSVERLRRPTGPGLVWLGFAKPEIQNFACLACGADGFKQGVLRAEGRSLCICGACASHQFHPPNPRRVTPDLFSIRYQIEYAADLTASAETASRAIQGRDGGRLLELGGRLGFVVDMVRHMPGWTAVGIDPGPWPIVGAARLGATLLRGGIEAAEAQAHDGGRFDVVIAENIIDRTLNPLALLRALPELSTDTARWLLAVPDAAALYEASDAETIRRAASETRVLLPSRIGFEALLARASLDLPVSGQAGMLRADRRPAAALSQGARNALLDDYLSRRAQVPPEDGSSAAGLLARAFERAVSRGDWPAARTLSERLRTLIEAASAAARAAEEQSSLEALFRLAPVSAASLLYHAGMLELNGNGALAQAVLNFESASALSRRAYALSPSMMAPEADRHYAARFHVGVVLRRLGDEAGARAILQAVSEAQGSRPHWAERARAELAGPVQPDAGTAIAAGTRAQGKGKGRSTGAARRRAT